MTGRRPAAAPRASWPLVGRADQVQTAVNAVRRERSVVVVAPSGCGRSRMLAEIVALVEGRGGTVRCATATTAAAGTPFGTIAPLLDGVGPAGWPSTLVSDAVQALATHGARPVLAIDDAHLLDAPSAALVLALVTAGAARVVVTVRTEVAAPDAVTALWKEGYAERIDLTPLAAGDVRELLAAALGGPVAQAATTLLHQLSDGHPRILRELISASLLDAALAHRDGMWFLDREPRPTPRLLDVVRDRWLLTGRSRDAAELLALSGPLPLGVVEALVGPNAVRELERAGMLTGDRDGAVGLARRLDADVLREGLRLVSRHDYLRTLLAALPADGADPDLDARVAQWRIELCRPVSASRLTVAARHAGEAGRHADAETLARKAVAGGGGTAARAVLAAAVLRRDPVAAADLAAGAGPAVHDDLDGAGSEGVNGAAARLRALRAVAVGEPARSGPPGADMRELVRNASRYDDAGWGGLAAWWDDRLRSGNDLDGALRLARQHRDGPPGVVRDLAELALGWSTQLSGDLRAAEAVLTELADRSAQVDPVRVAGPCRALLAQVRAQLGDPAGAARVCPISDVSADAPAWPVGSPAVEVALARAWIVAARGHVAKAIELVLAAADEITDDITGQGALVRAALRLGACSPRLAPSPIGGAPDANGLLCITARHADAARAGDVPGLQEVAAAYEAGGFALLAAEVWAAAWGRQVALGDRQGGWYAADRVNELARRCPGAATPALDVAARPLLHQLTAREQEAVRLAAGGHSNAEIARELQLSVRTIESHLYRAMTKLGVHRRRDLLGTTVPRPARPDREIRELTAVGVAHRRRRAPAGPGRTEPEIPGQRRSS